MKHLLTAIFVFLLLAVLEVSFVRALPLPFSYLPLVLASGVYLYQHLRFVAGLWWVVGFGFFLDILGLGVSPAETFCYALTALAVVFLGQRLFSNRSLYGVVGCSLSALVFLQFLHAIWFFLSAFNAVEPFPWINFLRFALWQAVLMVFWVSLFFFVSRRVLSAFAPPNGGATDGCRLGRITPQARREQRRYFRYHGLALHQHGTGLALHQHGRACPWGSISGARFSPCFHTRIICFCAFPPSSKK